MATIEANCVYTADNGLMALGPLSNPIRPKDPTTKEYVDALTVGTLTYAGTWSPAGGVYPADTVPGHYYIATDNGVVPSPPIPTSVTYYTGDWAIYNGSTHAYYKLSNVDSVAQFNAWLASNSSVTGIKTYTTGLLAPTRVPADNTLNVATTQFVETALAGIASGLVYMGTFNGGAVPGVDPVSGHFYVCATAGGIYAVGDWIVSNGLAWAQIPNGSYLNSWPGTTNVTILGPNITMGGSASESSMILSGSVQTNDGVTWTTVVDFDATAIAATNVMSASYNIVGFNSTSTTDYCHFTGSFRAKRVAGVVTVVTPFASAINAADAACSNCNVQAVQGAAGHLAVQVLGQAGANVKWTAQVSIVQHVI